MSGILTRMERGWPESARGRTAGAAAPACPRRAAPRATPPRPTPPRPAPAKSPAKSTATSTEETLSPLWRVICHDDPITTMDFVVQLLREVFRLPLQRAMTLMLEVHNSGAATVGRWPESTAKSRAERAQAKARAAGFPLTFTVEADD